MSLPPRPHPCARSPFVDRVSGWLETAWSRGWTEKPSLDPEEMWATACRAAPADGEGGPRCDADIEDFRLRLERLAESAATQARLNPLGLTMAYGQLVRVIRQRLKLGALWQKKPHVLETRVAAPVIVVGQMRSGTTRMHRLLAADPALAATRFCDSWHPVPRTPDTRPVWSALTLVFARALDPWIDAIHPFGVTRADEELGWLAASLDHSTYEAQWRIPAYTAFSEARDPAPIYREFSRILRTDADWRGNAGQTRVMKVPQFSEDLPTLLNQFPQARVIRTRRCESDSARSMASLIANQMAIQSDAVDLAWIEQEVERKIAMRQDRMESALGAFPGLQTEVSFDALNADWEAEIRRIYAEIDMDLTPAALSAMREEQNRARQSPHRGHQQQMKQFSETPA